MVTFQSSEHCKLNTVGVCVCVYWGAYWDYRDFIQVGGGFGMQWHYTLITFI